MMSTGEKIRTLRIGKGFTQKQLGDLCGMADSAIRRYESDRANPTLETVRRIASALDVSVIDLLPETDPVGEKIREARIKAGMSQRELAEKAGVTESFIAQCEEEQGKIDIDILGKISKALHISLGWLTPVPLFSSYKEAVEQFKAHQVDEVARECVKKILKTMYGKFEEEIIDGQTMYILADDPYGRAIDSEDVEIIISAVRNQIETLSKTLSGTVESMRQYEKYMALCEKEAMDALYAKMGEEE